MVLRSGYLALALKLQEATEKHPDKFKEKLNAALAAETEPGPWKDFLEAGARHSASDMGHLQAIHDASMVLGASCGGGAMEEASKAAAVAMPDGSLRLMECATEAEPIQLSEAKADYQIKLIAAGRGAMAVYPKDVLQRDGPIAFPADTKIYFNHPTKMEASEPVGNRDVKRFAGVTTGPAKWLESHPKGEGLYAPAKFFSDHAQQVEEKGAHLGMSVILNGHQKMESGRPVFDKGLPILSKITSGESVDVVPIAGAGGLIVQESAADPKAGVKALENLLGIPKFNPTQEAGMTAEEVQKLVEASIRTARLPDEARAEANRLLETVALKDETKADIVESVLRGTIPVKEGALDKEALAPLVVAEAQRIGRMLARESGGAQVRGMGIGAFAQPAPKPEEIAAREAAAKREQDDSIAVFESLGMSKRAAEFAAKGRAA